MKLRARPAKMADPMPVGIPLEAPNKAPSEMPREPLVDAPASHHVDAPASHHVDAPASHPIDGPPRSLDGVPAQAPVEVPVAPLNIPETPPVPFSWLDSHPIFVIILVGPDEVPFGIQKDLLCARSAYFREHFRALQAESLEHIVKLPDTPAETFAYAQHFLFTGSVFPADVAESLPSYDVLVGVWKLGHALGVDGLCDATLDAMAECRRLTESIPATPLLVQVWRDTPEDSSIRKLLLTWAAEYMRSSEARKEFAKSLPQEVLSELVVAMSSLDASPLVHQPAGAAAGAQGHHHSRKNVHYLEADGGLGGGGGGVAANGPAAKKARHSDGLSNGIGSGLQMIPKAPGGKKARASLPAAKPVAKRRSVVSFSGDQPYSADQKMNFCADLLARMLSGPGFWTRLVGPFKEPVDPATDGVPDYHDKVKRPMDLGTMKAKMDRREYADERAFAGDMRQIFANCYTYWSRKDPMWAACEKLEKTFEEKYSQMNKWISKMEGEEGL